MKQLIGIHTNMGSSGRFVLRSMQDNNEMPLVDLFVREVLQNSLDAGTGKGRGLKNNISVDFIIDKFDSKKLNEELEGSTPYLNKAFPDEQYEYLAIKDCNTVGLNGKIEDSEYKENEPLGNFKKLVYEIGEPQENTGSGGSWGLGKTVYFRIGIGLVLYYSQFKDEKGKLQSRLAATLVEDRKHIKYQPPVKGQIRTGIAWWGETKPNNVTVPITNKKDIKNILSYFNLSPFTEDETGSIIIIPYINEEELISQNKFQYEDLEGNVKSPYWIENIKDNLKMAIQRWYFPRIKNADYKYGQYLTVSVCGEELTPKKFAPLFQILWEMYKVGSANIELSEDSFCKSNGIDPKAMPVTLTGYFQNNTLIGNLVYAKVQGVKNTGAQLFQLKPYYYINENPDNTTRNRPIIPFVRKPGLIINYNADASWINKDFDVSDDEYIIGIFVLNSDNKFKTTYADDLTLEDYVRSGEKAQHTEWIDQDIDKKPIKVIHNIKKAIKKHLSEDFSINKDTNIILSQSSYSHRFSSILPPINFGNSSAYSGKQKGQKTKGKGGGRKKTAKSELVLDYENLIYSKEGLTINGKLYIGRQPGIINISLSINSDGKETALEEWLNNDRLEAPFEFIQVITSEQIRCKYLKSLDKKAFACEFDARDFTSEIIDISIELRIFKQDFEPAIKMKEIEGETE